MLPPDFIQELACLLGNDEASLLAAAVASASAPTSIRLNPRKPMAADRLPAPVAGRVPWCDSGRYLAERPAFTWHPLLHAGCYYVQEASSMYIEQAWRRIAEDTMPRRVLDLCAAPGGKSTLWRTLLPDDCLLVANEPIRPRASVLAENLLKWGHPNVVCTMAYPGEFAPLGSYFDVVAADVPCSGEGMFRKDTGAVEEWSAEAVERCAARQMQIVRDVWPALRDGGWLVYSTCTYNSWENEDNVARICSELGAECVTMAQCADWGVAGDTTGRGLSVCHFFPHKVKGEGFFLALLRKTSTAPVWKEKKRKAPACLPPAPPQVAAGMLRQLEAEARYVCLTEADGSLSAVDEAAADGVRSICARVRHLLAGVPLASPKGRKWVPSQGLALSVIRRGGSYPEAALSLTQAQAYLRREALTLEAGAERGYVLATYEGHALGFLHNIGARANNLYPAEWRIRSGADRAPAK